MMGSVPIETDIELCPLLQQVGTQSKNELRAPFKKNGEKLRLNFALYKVRN